MAGLSTTAKILKFIIFACNIISFLFGLTVVILGIIDLVHFESIFEARYLSLTNVIAVGAVANGLFIVLVACLGLFGALRANANVLIAIRSAVFATIREIVHEAKRKYGSSTKWTAITDWMEATDCANVIPSAVEAELVTIGGCLLGITLLSFFASGMAFVLARNVKVYDKL